MPTKLFLKDLNQFLGKAALATYAAGGAETTPERPGFRELEFAEGAWSYRDSYTGYLRSWGTELVRYNGEPVWNALYGGGMTVPYRADAAFAHRTFEFLKKALSAGEKKEAFQPRGQKNFTDGYWEYQCDWDGDITEFIGHEAILYKGDIVFTHDFFGGLIVSDGSREEKSDE